MPPAAFRPEPRWTTPRAPQFAAYVPSNLTGDVDLVYTTPGAGELAVKGRHLTINPGAGNRNVDLPAVAQSAGVELFIHVPIAATNNVVVRTPAGVALCTAVPGRSVVAFCDGVVWRATVLQPSGSGIVDFGALGLKTDVIAESTAATGVTIDGMLVKDYGIDWSALATGQPYVKLPTNKADALSILDSAGDLVVFDTTTGSQLVTWTTANAFSSGIKTDTVAEKTAAAGVTIDGLTLKDKGIDWSALLTTEPYMALPANKADALSIYDSAGDIVVVDTTTGAVKVKFVATPQADVIEERTAATGVTIDGCLVKDGKAAAALLADEATQIVAASIFKSAAPVAGTGAPVNVAHGLGTVPRLVIIFPVAGHNGAGAIGDKMPQITEGAHDATNCIFSCEAGALVMVIAIK